MSPWLDSTAFSSLEEDLATLKAQAHRRFIKSHLPFDALPLWDTVKYIHVGRDGRDASLSFHNHMQGVRPEFVAKLAARAAELAAAGGGQGAGPPPPSGPPPSDPADHLGQWLDRLEATPAAGPTAEVTFFDFEATYWRERARPNLLLTHYDDMIGDLSGEMRRISDFLEIDTPAALLPKLVEAARFSAMKADGDALIPQLKLAFDRGADRFIHQGRSGRWRELARPADVARYEAVAARFPPDMVAWLERGRRRAGDPKETVTRPEARSA